MLNTWGNTYVNGSFNSTLVSPTVLRSMTVRYRRRIRRPQGGSAFLSLGYRKVRILHSIPILKISSPNRSLCSSGAYFYRVPISGTATILHLSVVQSESWV